VKRRNGKGKEGLEGIGGWGKLRDKNGTFLGKRKASFRLSAGITKGS